MRDGVHYADADAQGLHLFDVRNPGLDSLVPLNLPESATTFDDFVFSPDETRILLRTNVTPVYRHSVIADYYVYDLKTQRATNLFDQGIEQFAEFAPDGHKVAFVSGNNLYYRDVTMDKNTQITTDGAANKVLNGLPDWVYEEEFSPMDGNGMKALAWSPDGTKIAFLRFDESLVPEMPLTWYEGDAYPRYSKFKYPKVGEQNSTVTAHVFDLKTGKITLVNTEYDGGGDHYLPRLHWTPDGRLVITRLNRGQDVLELLIADDNTGAVSLLHRETDPAYVEIESENKLIFLKNRPQFMWMSEQSGFSHLYLYSIQPAAAMKPIALTSGAYDLTAFYGVDEKNGKFYYQTATPTPLDRQIWEGSLEGAAPRLLTPGNGTHEAAFSPTFDYYTLTRSDVNTPPVVELREISGKVVRVLTDNDRVRRNLKTHSFVSKEFFSFKLPGDTISLNGWMLQPKQLQAGKKYPVLIDIYGGPGSQTVQNQYDGYYDAWRQMLVQKGIIVVSVDNRGTGARGRDFKKCTQLELGKLETEDQISAARYLGTLPYVDAARIGIWGWSFGGYLSTSCILKGNDVFKMAVAVAPVVNWKWYDSVYTERYMRTAKENAGGYERNSPINFANLLKGDNYLLCHGIADDNVHWQQSAEMVNALIKANKQFEQHYYPNRNHGIYGDNATIHLFSKITEFVQEQLQH